MEAESFLTSFTHISLALYGHLYHFLPRNLVGRLISKDQVLGWFTSFYDPAHSNILGKHNTILCFMIYIKYILHAYWVLVHFICYILLWKLAGYQLYISYNHIFQYFITSKSYLWHVLVCNERTPVVYITSLNSKRLVNDCTL